MNEEAGARTSAGLLVFRRRDDVEVLIGHMGGPFWARKDERAWSAPKGVVEPRETPLAAALREFHEECGFPPPQAPCDDLGVVRQRSGKRVRLYAVEGDPDLTDFRPGTFPMTRGGRTFQVPELDRVVWAPLPRAAVLLTEGQVPFLERLQRLLQTRS